MPRLTAEQRTVRASGITATDIVKLAGLSSYGDPYTVWQEKLDPHQSVYLEPADPEAAEMGHRLEGLVLERYRETTGRHVVAVAHTKRHPAFPLALATLDAEGIDEADQSFLVEVKTQGHPDKAWGEPWTAEVPERVNAQVQWQMFVCGASYADVALLHTTHRFAIYRVPYNAELALALYGLAEEFWTRHVKPQVEPPILDWRTAGQRLAARFATPTDAVVPATPEDEVLLRQLAEAYAHRVTLDGEIETVKNLLKDRMGYARKLFAPTVGAATWYAVKGRTTTKHEAVYADLVAQGIVVPTLLDQLKARHTTVSAPTRAFKFTPEGSV